MPRSAIRLCLAGAALALAADAAAIIQRLTSLKEVLATEDYVFTAVLEKMDTGAPSAVFLVKEDLKGKTPFRRLPVSLTGDAEGYAEMAKNLGTTNLADLTPSRAAYYLLFTHPSIPERIQAALSAKRPTTE